MHLLPITYAFVCIYSWIRKVLLARWLCSTKMRTIYMCIYGQTFWQSMFDIVFVIWILLTCNPFMFHIFYSTLTIFLSWCVCWTVLVQHALSIASMHFCHTLWLAWVWNLVATKCDLTYPILSTSNMIGLLLFIICSLLFGLSKSALGDGSHGPSMKK